MKFKFYFALFSVMLGVLSCNEEKETKSEVVHLNFNTKENIRNIYTSELFSDYQIFVLRDSVLDYRDIRNHGLYGDKHLLFCGQMRPNAVLKAYDKEGNFLNNIGNFGRGRGEYISMGIYFHICPDSTISVVSAFDGLYNFNIDGSFNCKKAGLANDIRDFAIYKEYSKNKYLIFKGTSSVVNMGKFTQQNTNKYDNVILATASHKNNDIKEPIKIDSILLKEEVAEVINKHTNLVHPTSFYEYDGKQNFVSNIYGTIYEINDNCATPRYTVTVEDDSFDGARTIETDDYLLIGEKLYYDKKEGKCYVVKIIDDMVMPKSLDDSKRTLGLPPSYTSYGLAGTHARDLIVTIPKMSENKKQVIGYKQKNNTEGLTDMINESRKLMTSEEWDCYTQTHPEIMKLYNTNKKESKPMQSEESSSSSILVIYKP